MPVGMALLEPTRLYAQAVLSLMEKVDIHGMAHITGGGLYENVPRMFSGSEPLSAVVREGSWAVPPIFARIAAGCYNAGSSGPIAQKLGADLLKNDAAMRKQMFSVFNMGIGFVLALAPEDARAAAEHLDGMGFPAWEIGYIEKAAGASAENQGLRFA